MEELIFIPFDFIINSLWQWKRWKTRIYLLISNTGTSILTNTLRSYFRVFHHNEVLREQLIWVHAYRLNSIIQFFLLFCQLMLDLFFEVTNYERLELFFF